MKSMMQLAAAFGVVTVAAPLFAQDKPLTPEENEFFEAKIRPALIEHCHKCHSADKDAKTPAQVAAEAVARPVVS